MGTPLRVGVVGMGGFAASHHQALLRLEEQGHVRVAATSDPRPERYAAEREKWRFETRGVRVFADYRSMFEAARKGLDYVVVAAPIHVHGEIHGAATALGLPVYLEKPPTLDCAELEQMIAADRAAPKAALVAFNFMVEKPRLALKARLLAGEFGAIRQATIQGVGPRPESYYQRNGWSGRLLVHGRILLDSCFGNAMAHFVHNLLFWCGEGGLNSWAPPAAVRAELYRAHDIESADTLFVEARLASKVPVRLALTHAAVGATTMTETVFCEKAVLTYLPRDRFDIRWSDGRGERIDARGFEGLPENHLAYGDYLRGESPRPATSLAESRPFVALNDLAFLSSARIAPIPTERVSTLRTKEGEVFRSVSDMAEKQEKFLREGRWPGAEGWNRAVGAWVGPGDLGRLPEAVRAMTAPPPPDS